MKPHQTRPVQVWADVDLGIADMVAYLNTIPGVRTHASCQGTLGEGGPAPYRPQVLTTWPPEAFERLQRDFDIDTTLRGENWAYLYPRASSTMPEPRTYAPPVPILDYLQAREGKTWTKDDTLHVRRHMTKVDDLACELIERAKKGRIK